MTSIEKIKNEKRTLLEEKRSLKKQLQLCDEALKNLNKKELKAKEMSNKILTPLRDKYNKLCRQRIFVKNLPVKIILTWDSDTRPSMDLDYPKWPAKTKLEEYIKYTQEIKALDEEIKRVAKEHKYSAAEFWDLIAD